MMEFERFQPVLFEFLEQLADHNNGPVIAGWRTYARALAAAYAVALLQDGPVPPLEDTSYRYRPAARDAFRYAGRGEGRAAAHVRCLWHARRGHHRLR
jgi:hypothetical protein